MFYIYLNRRVFVMKHFTVDNSSAAFPLVVPLRLFIPFLL